MTSQMGVTNILLWLSGCLWDFLAFLFGNYIAVSVDLLSF
jgi:hypothetical protein